MANFIQQFNAGGITYDLHDSEFIIDTRTASGAALTGATKAAALFDGMQITFWMSYAAASNATLNLTLADGTTTGAIPCYYSGTTRMGTQYAAGNAIHFTYRENVTIGTTTVTRGWWGDANYSVSDTNYDIVGTSIPIRTRLNAYCLCAMVGTSGTIAKQTRTVGAGTYWEINAFTQSSGTAQTKELIPNQGYYPGKLFYYTGSSAITDADAVSGTISASTNNMDLRYTVNGSSSANIGVTGAPFFLVGSIGSDGLFYPNGHASEATAEWWQCGFPTDLTSTYVYWYVGMMTSKYQCRLSDHNWMLKSDGTKWIVFDGAKKVHWDNIEGKPSTFTPSSHTHGYIGNDGSVAPSVSASPASGDKILISDLTDSNKVKGGPEIGGNDGKFLRHDGVWDIPDDHILVMTGTLTGGMDDPITTTTSWSDFVNAVNNHDRLLLVVQMDVNAFLNVDLQFKAGDLESDLDPYAVVIATAVAPRYGGGFSAPIVGMIAEPSNNNVRFQYDTNSIFTTVDLAQYASNVDWSGIEMNPYPTSVPYTNGNYTLNVSDGTTSWTPASDGLQPPGSSGDYYLNDDGVGNTTWMPMSGASVDYATTAGTANSADSVDWSGVQNTPTIPNTPDAPVSYGRYVLMVDSGSSSWEEEALVVVFDRIDMSTGQLYSSCTFGSLLWAVLTNKKIFFYVSISGLPTLPPYEVVSIGQRNDSQIYMTTLISYFINIETMQGMPVSPPSLSTWEILDDEDGISVSVGSIMYGLSDTLYVNEDNNSFSANNFNASLSNGLLSFTESTTQMAIQAPSGHGTVGLKFVVYPTD